jgi:hypothetical protein
MVQMFPSSSLLWRQFVLGAKLGAFVVASILGVIGIPGLALALLLPSVHDAHLRPGDAAHAITGYLRSLLLFTFCGSGIGAFCAALWSWCQSATSEPSEAGAKLVKHPLRKALWASGILWLLSWFALYLEIYRWHHVTPSLHLSPPPPPPGTDIQALPGEFLIAVLGSSALAPVVFVALLVWDRLRAFIGSKA